MGAAEVKPISFPVARLGPGSRIGNEKEESVAVSLWFAFVRRNTGRASGLTFMLSRSTGYALKALAYLATQEKGRMTGAREIAAATEIPMPFLWKVLRHLSRSNLVSSSKGVQGGYKLARPANRITLQLVVETIQRENPAMRCALNPHDCEADEPCVLHRIWTPLRECLQTTLAKTTIADLAPKKRRTRRRRS